MTLFYESVARVLILHIEAEARQTHAGYWSIGAHSLFCQDVGRFRSGQESNIILFCPLHPLSSDCFETSLLFKYETSSVLCWCEENQTRTVWSLGRFFSHTDIKHMNISQHVYTLSSFRPWLYELLIYVFEMAVTWTLLMLKIGLFLYFIEDSTGKSQKSDKNVGNRCCFHSLACFGLHYTVKYCQEFTIWTALLHSKLLYYH